MALYNQDAWRMVEEKVKDEISASEEASAATAEQKAADAVGVFISKGETLPSSAEMVGQLFVKTGTSAGLYVSTGTTTPGWKAVSHAQ